MYYMQTINYNKTKGSFIIKFVDDDEIIERTINMDENSINVNTPLARVVIDNNEGDVVEFTVDGYKNRIEILKKEIEIVYEKTSLDNLLSPSSNNIYYHDKEGFINICYASKIDNENIFFQFYYKPAEHKILDTPSFRIIGAFKKGPLYVDYIKDTYYDDWTFMVKVFYKKFIKRFNIKFKDYVFCMVPSHEASECNANPLSMLINEITYFHPESNGSQALIRFKTIVPQKKCSIREEHVHLDSICVPNKKVIEGKKVILIDDITTSGSSLKACKKNLLDNGAKEVIMFAFGRS